MRFLAGFIFGSILGLIALGTMSHRISMDFEVTEILAFTLIGGLLTGGLTSIMIKREWFNKSVKQDPNKTDYIKFALAIPLLILVLLISLEMIGMITLDPNATYLKVLAFLLTISILLWAITSHWRES